MITRMQLIRTYGMFLPLVPVPDLGGGGMGDGLSRIPLPTWGCMNDLEFLPQASPPTLSPSSCWSPASPPIGEHSCRNECEFMR